MTKLQVIGRKETYIFVIDLDPTVIVRIKLPERICQGLHRYAGLDKVIKSNVTPACLPGSCQFG